MAQGFPSSLWADFSFCDYVFVEDKQSIIERIREATDYLPVNQLCLSPKEIAESIWK